MSMPDVETIRGYYMNDSWNDMMLRTAKVCKAITEEQFEAMRVEKADAKAEKAVAKTTKTTSKSSTKKTTSSTTKKTTSSRSTTTKKTTSKKTTTAVS